VAVTYGTILVADDTDDFGTGELAFRYQIFHPSTDFWQPNVSLDHVNDPPSGYYDLASGDAYWPIVTLHSGPLDAESIVVAISALEDDAPWYYGTNHAGDQFRGTGSNDDYEWNSAAVGVALPGITLVNPVAPTLADAEEFYTEIAIHVTETDDTCLEYSVFVGVHMTYQ
jgi:hypothetical protein